MTLSIRECCLFFMHAMCDVLAKRHFGNGMVECGRFLLVDAIVDKQLISIRIQPIAVEAFGRHLKRVDASALFFCLDVIFGLSKLASQFRKDEIACDFLFAYFFSDVSLLSLNSLRFSVED